MLITKVSFCAPKRNVQSVQQPNTPPTVPNSQTLNQDTVSFNGILSFLKPKPEPVNDNEYFSDKVCKKIDNFINRKDNDKTWAKCFMEAMKRMSEEGENTNVQEDSMSSAREVEEDKIREVSQIIDEARESRAKKPGVDKDDPVLWLLDECKKILGTGPLPLRKSFWD